MTDRVLIDLSHLSAEENTQLNAFLDSGEQLPTFYFQGVDTPDSLAFATKAGLPFVFVALTNGQECGDGAVLRTRDLPLLRQLLTVAQRFTDSPDLLARVATLSEDTAYTVTQEQGSYVFSVLMPPSQTIIDEEETVD